MGAPGWQDLAVALIAVAAVAWLAWRRLNRRKRPTPFCDDCPACNVPAPRPDAPPAAPDGHRLISESELFGR